jgi:hypothetical protein
MTKHRKPRFAWDDLAVQILRAGYPDMPTAQIAADLRLAVSQVHAKAAQLGLKKSAAFMASQSSGRIQRANTDPRMTATRFAKGMTPWNKGTSYVAGGRSRETQFKPGSKPHTTVPVGSYRVTNCKGVRYLEQKVNDLPGNNCVRWKGVHRLVWEAHHGPVPPGHLVVFKSQDLRSVVLEEITIDKLELRSRHDHAMRNHPRNIDPALGQLVQLKGAITRQVNRLAKEHKEQRA